MDILILNAHRTDVVHRFIEIFTADSKLRAHRARHPEVSADLILKYEVDHLGSPVDPS